MEKKLSIGHKEAKSRQSQQDRQGKCVGTRDSAERQAQRGEDTTTEGPES